MRSFPAAIHVLCSLVFVQVTTDVAQLLGEHKVDAILCVAGGWAGGSCSSKGQRLIFLFAVTVIIRQSFSAGSKRAAAWRHFIILQ